MRNQKKSFLSFILAALVFFLIGGKIHSQTTLVTLEGVISDAEGNPLSGVSITVKNSDTGYVYSTTSRTDGRYILSGILAGNYELEASISGFAKEKRAGLVFNVGAKVSMNFSLKISSLEEEITVTAVAPMVEVTKSEISTVVDRKKIENMPLVGRDFANLTTMTPGVIDGRSNAMSTGMEETVIDGMSNEQIIQNGNRNNVPADAIQEFRVMTNQFEAEYGHTGGMLRNAITRTGTNTLQGRAGYFYRDEALDTPNYFVNHSKYNGPELPKDKWSKAKYQHNNFAGFLGGPIIRDKAHFFFAYDGIYRTTYSTITSPLVAQESIDVPDNLHLGLIKLSYQPSEKHIFSFRSEILYEKADNLGIGGLNTKERGYKFNDKNFEFQVNWTFFLSDNKMNEFRAIYVIDDHNFDVQPEFKGTYSIIRPSGNFGKPNNYDQYNFADRYQIVDNFSYFLSKHNIKTGIDFMYIPSGASLMENFYPGEFLFRTDKPFNAADKTTYPAQFTYCPQAIVFTLQIYLFSAFIQDSWRITPQLTLNYGLRYSLYDYSGVKLKKFTFNNFNPRFAFSWDPLGDGKTVVRGGIGTYTANPMANIGYQPYVGQNVKTYVLLNPGYPDPTKPNPFVPGGIAGAPPADVYLFGNAPLTYSLQMTVGVQREVITDISLGLDLIWTKGYNMITWENSNPVIPGTGTKRADPSKGSVWAITDIGKADYKGLYLAFSKRYSHGWSFDVGYTFSKAVGNTEGQDRPWTNEPNNWDRAWGRKNNDARHKLTVAGMLDLPLGFQVSSILYYRSKYPWNATYPGDPNKDSLLYDYVDQYRNSRIGFDEFYIHARVAWSINFSRFRFQVLGEVFNVTNRTNFYNVYNRYGLTGFGEPRQAGDPRLVQIGARFDF